MGLIIVIVIGLFVVGCSPARTDRPWQQHALEATEIVWAKSLGMKTPFSLPIVWIEDCSDWAEVPGGRVGGFGGCEAMTIVYGETIRLRWTGSYSSSYFAQALWREAFYEIYKRTPTSGELDLDAVAQLNANLASVGL